MGHLWIVAAHKNAVRHTRAHNPHRAVMLRRTSRARSECIVGTCSPRCSQCAIELHESRQRLIQGSCTIGDARAAQDGGP